MTLGNDNGMDGQTDRQSVTQYAAPPREEGRIITTLATRWHVMLMLDILTLTLNLKISIPLTLITSLTLILTVILKTYQTRETCPHFKL